jgi:7-carboxy-7-deazaguanine synthase
MEEMMDINSIFKSINGEVSALGQGSLCTFVRTQGCNLNCKNCDTKQAQKVYKKTKDLFIREIVEQIQIFGLKNITITGGEPLEQIGDVLKLCKKLKMEKEEYTICIETNGSIPIPYSEYVDCWIADWKTPSSGMNDKMNLINFLHLSSTDFVKFVIKDRTDFDDAVFCLKNIYRGYTTPRFAFSPMFNNSGVYIQPSKIMEWMLADEWCKKTKAIFNLQLHKMIGVP